MHYCDKRLCKWEWISKLFVFSLYKGELDFIERLLEEDVRNNSAWNQRFFVVQHEAGDGDDSVFGGALLQRELDYVKTAIDKVSFSAFFCSTW